MGALALVAAGGAGPGWAAPVPARLCGHQTAGVGGGQYALQSNEWNSSAVQCVDTDGNADFQVTTSQISNPTDGAPGGYPSLYRGCHYGDCTPGSGFPIPVGGLGSGVVTSSWSTTQPGSGAYDAAYDIWYGRTSATRPDGAELMVWLNHNGGVQPAGTIVASNVRVGGRTYDLWYQSAGPTISYALAPGVTSVDRLDVGLLTADSVSRGYIARSCYLLDVEAGFELWQGGAGLATNSFSVSVR